MAKRKQPAAGLYLIDQYHLRIAVRPLFGLNRLVKLQHRKRSGILHCENVVRLSDSITFSPANKQKELYRITFGARLTGVLGDPQLNVPNEATSAELDRFYEDGTQAIFCFTPRKGQTFLAECDIYKPLDPGNRVLHTQLPDDARIANYSLTLDASAYLKSGYSVEGARCGYEENGANGKGGAAAEPVTRGLLPTAGSGKGVWTWTVKNVLGGAVRLTWETEKPDQAAALKSLNLDRLATELSVNPRLAKDLHNFVSICHHFAAGTRSLNKIGPAMITNRSVVNRSLETIEAALGTELIRRTQGKGLIAITPAGHAVLDWWSQFYMRWTPITTETTGP